MAIFLCNMSVDLHAFLSLFMTLSLLTLNTGGCSNAMKNASVFSYVDNIAFDSDIVFLQEINDLSQNSQCWNLWSSYKPFCAPGHNRGSGVATLVKNNLCSDIDSLVILNSHIIYVKIEFDGGMYHLYNVLMPQDDGLAIKAVHLLAYHVNQCSDGVIIIGGDYNCTLSPSLDRLCMPNEHRPKLSSALKEVIDSNKLCDTWRRLHPHEKKYSWHRNNPHSVNGVSKARLDRFYVSFPLIPSLHSCRILPCTLSDHCAISLKIKIPPQKPRGCAFWHLNNSLLDDNDYRSIIIHFWTDWQNKKADFPNILSWWDFGKSHIKVLTQMYGSKLANEKKETILNINKTIDELHSSPEFTPDIQQALAEQRTELNILLKNQAKGALVRSRFQYANEIDTSSSYFYGLEKSNSTFKTLSRTRLPSGNITEDQNDIKIHVRNFYKNLYCRVPIDENSVDTILSDLSKLNPEDSKHLDAPLSFNELDIAVTQLGKNKTPGLDGLSSEFYQTFWPLIKNDLFSVLQYAISTGTLPHTFRRAVITLIPKKGDLADIANWRPVSLLNNDYKIFAKILANRLKHYITNIVSEDQTYCVPGRTIYDNLNLIRDIVHFSNCNDTPLAVVNLDQRKAFDNVDHNYLFNTMRAMGFGEYFISCIQLLYNDAEGLVKVCGSLTAPFPFQKGIRQGCPLSGFLYSIAIEPFLHKLKVNLSSCSFSLPNTDMNVSVSAYADDISIFVTEDKGFDIILDTYNTFSKASAACLNYVKSQGLWAGSWSKRRDRPLDFLWNCEGLLFLGVHLGNNNNYVNKNWSKCKEKLSKTLSRWSSLSYSLSFKGRIIIANQLAASKLFHCLAVLSPPQQTLIELQEMLINYVWSGKRHLLRKQILFQQPNKGGLGLVCLQARTLTFRFAFLQRYLNLCSHPAYALCSHNFRRYKKLNLDFPLFLTELDPKFYTSLPCFYSEILRAWITSGASVETSSFTVNHVLNIPLNYYKFLQYTLDGDKIFPVRLFACGIKLVKHLVNPNNGTWLRADEVVIASTLQRPSLRLLELDLSRLHKEISGLFPRFFSNSGLRLSAASAYLHNLTEPVTSPFSIITKDNKNILATPTKSIYRIFNRAINFLPRAQVTHWHEAGLLSPSKLINWTEIYCYPSSKKDGDTQYKLLHNVLPSLAVLHHLNPDISSSCGWCGKKGTILHLFIECTSIQPALDLLHHLLSSLLPEVNIDFDLYWTLVPHARGRNREAVRLSNFFIVILKSTLYWLYRTSRFLDPLPFWKLRIKNRVILDYEFHKLQNNLVLFHKIWSYNNVLFLSDDNDLTWLI